MKKICVFQDTENIGKTIDLLEVARRMYEEFQSHAIVMEKPFHPLRGWFHHIVHVTEGLVDGYDPRGICDILENLHQKNRFDTILIPATIHGKMIAPRLATRLRVGLISNVTDVKNREGGLEFIRPACAGKILEGVHHTGKSPIIMTIRPNAFEYRSEAVLETDVFEYTQPVTARSHIQRLHVEENKETCDIRDSQVLISGGGGVKESFPQLYRLAEALNGNVAASRKLVDQGVAPRSIQVGQSGKTVSPKLYMALGIHGSMQHLAGLRQVESIISINTAGNAPICFLSDIVVQGDAREFMDKLIKKISIYRSEKKGN